MPLALALCLLIAGQGPGIVPHLRPETVILTYHDVIPERDASALWFDCTTGELESQLDWMTRQGVHFISLDQVYLHLTKGDKLPSKPVAITFADGYAGFWERGYPILKRRHIPVTMFVHTGYVGVLTQGRPKMNWPQLKALDREGLVTVASETVSHPADLGKLSEVDIRKELASSKAKLELELGHPVRYLAYPNGKFSAACERIAKACGYWMAFSERTHPAEYSASLFSVNRYVHTKYRLAIQSQR